MSSAIRDAFPKDRCAFIPYLTAGFPDSSTCEEILAALASAGADVIEVGLPFSDPLADGPTIQSASRQALDNGTNVAEVFRIIERVQGRARSVLAIMTYYNPILRMGHREFVRRACDAGVSGAIVPDLPPEEADAWIEACGTAGLDTIFLVAPTTPMERVGMIGSLSKGFVYYVSMTGVTGGDCAISSDMLAGIDLVKRLSDVPVAVGFGISTPQQAVSVSKAADGVIVGSALIREIRAESGPTAQVDRARDFAASFVEALANATATRP
ncbi:MAG: tryptophan synthase subunit alpha [Thermodesulfobacteriota bacterium]